MKFNTVEEVINSLRTDVMKELAINLANTIPDYWYHVPASSSGKYHPSYALGEGGLARHTFAACEILSYIFDVNYFSDMQKDMMMIAMLMHDTRKSGSQAEYNNNVTTKFEHPLLAAEVILNYEKVYPNISEEIEDIAKMVACHMNKWNTSDYSDVELPVPVSYMERMVALSDYLASRKNIILQGD